jgi:hypothetical protein
MVSTIKRFFKRRIQMNKRHNKSEETNQKTAGGFLIAHFNRYIKVFTLFENFNMPVL